MRFKLFNIPVHIHITFLLFAAFLGSSRLETPTFLVTWVIVVCFSVLVHEFGHALADKYFGGNPSIQLVGIAGLTYTAESVKDYKKKILITAAGPLFGFVLGALSYLIEHYLVMPNFTMYVILRDLMWVNLAWSVFNLFPIYPLDGGQILLALMKRLSKKYGEIISFIISLLISLPLAIYFLFQKDFYLALLLGALSAMSFQKLYIHFSRGEDSAFNDAIEQVYQFQMQQDYQAAIEAINFIIDDLTKERVKEEMLEQKALCLYNLDECQKAIDILSNLKLESKQKQELLGLSYAALNDYDSAILHLRKVVSFDSDVMIKKLYLEALIHEEKFTEVRKIMDYSYLEDMDNQALFSLIGMLWDKNDFDAVIKINKYLFEVRKQYKHKAAYNLSCAFSQKGDLQKALAWLKQAVKSGYSDFKHILEDEDLKALREEEDFKIIINQLKK